MNMSDIQFFAANPNCAYVRGTNLRLSQKQTQANRGRIIHKSLGLKAAVNFMKKNGWSAEACVDTLLRTTFNILKGV